MNDYKGRPGFAKISASEYGILRRSRKESQEITKNNWNKVVLPGTDLVLSIIIRSVANERQRYFCDTKLSNSAAQFWCVFSFKSSNNFLTTSSKQCGQHYNLVTTGKESTDSDPRTFMVTKTIDAANDERAEKYLYKHMHLLPSNDANSSNEISLNLPFQISNQRKSEISNSSWVRIFDSSEIELRKMIL